MDSQTITTTTVTERIVKPSGNQQDAPMCPTQQSILQITLAGPALVSAILVVNTCIYLLQPSFTVSIIALAMVSSIVHNDYKNFVSLGPGGTPPTFLGYCKITYLRLFTLKDPYTAPLPSAETYPTIGYCQRKSSWLPTRSGPRPQIAGIAPQRQVSQTGCPRMYQLLRTRISNVALQKPDLFITGISCFEKSGLALFARTPINNTCRGEIVHVHNSDRSMHMNLHPDDAKLVIEKGWGERHPLSKGNWLRKYVPQQFMMVYAPRDKAELDVVCRIIAAAAFWTSGEIVRLDLDVAPAQNLGETD